jgi:predicted pyridoxine 5'-phosphate oxidase superfamily flavin-nucleotide-binding protein
MSVRDDGPFHPGEREVQRRAGVEDDARRVGRIIGDRLPREAGPLLAGQRFVVAASVDGAGRVWASLLTGPAGFLRVEGEAALRIAALPAEADPLTDGIDTGAKVGLLVIDFAHRRRLRLNGRARADAGGLLVAFDQVYGNCPKYIEPRSVTPAAPAGVPRVSGALDSRQRRWTEGSDTFFIASYHPTAGADASHRGGPPGFVQASGPRTLTFADLPGNNMFNTLGNLAAEPRAGLLFLDFARGGMLQLTGRATIGWKAASEPQARVSFTVDEVRETAGGGVTLVGAPASQ